MPYSVEQIIQNPADLTCVQIDEPIIHALDLMIRHNFSQLPILDADGRLLGMVTYESIMRATRSFNVKLESLCVRDALVKAPTHYQDDDLFDLLDDLKNTNAVIITDPNEHPVGIVTSFDTTDFLRDRTEDSMRLEEVELTIKDFIKSAYRNEKGETDKEKLNQAIEGLFIQKDIQPNKGPRAFEELTLNDYIILLTDRFAWPILEPTLKIKRDALVELLQKIRKTRNDIAHFRGDISARERDDLRFCAEWLTRKYQEYEEKSEKEFVQQLVKSIPELQPERLEVREVKNEFMAVSGSVQGKKPGRLKSRYAALAIWLSQKSEEKITLTFEQIEGIIDSPLPDSARVFRAWWANDTVGHTHSILWLDAGWRVESVNLSEEWVRFIRQI
jgi:CBS domain-containing protein